MSLKLAKESDVDAKIDDVQSLEILQWSAGTLSVEPLHFDNKYIRLSNATSTSVSIDGASPAFTEDHIGRSITLWRTGTAGTVSFVGANGATINKKAAYSLSQNEAAVLIMVGIGEWDLL